MLYHQLQTIKQQMQELNPEKTLRIQSTGELDKMLEKYKDQMMSARREAVWESRIKNMEYPDVAVKTQEQAVKKAQEMKLCQIIEELGYLFQQSSVYT